jgi:hypothetical protein
LQDSGATLPAIRVVLLAGILNAILLGQDVVARIVAGPLPSPQEIASLESHVLQNPEDMDARLRLLQLYLDIATPSLSLDSGRRTVRLQHILYLVEHHPEAAASASRAAYVYRTGGPYANAADHDDVRDRWLGAVQAHAGNFAVTMNAVKFLEREDQDDAARVLRRALDADPENREIAANLGFLYAMEILAGHATTELEQSSNAIVLAAGGTALPNLAVRGSAGRVVNEKIFDLASKVSAQARQLAPDDADIQGPMPLIKYFAAWQAGSSVAKPPGQLPVPGDRPTRIRVGENVQAANLIRRVQPQYPDGVIGEVRLSVMIDREGAVRNVELISGDPLLAGASMHAVESWLYRPTLLNGSPVEVETTITVRFPPN